MPNLHEVRREIYAGHNAVRERRAEALHQLTGRNVILYYSGWLQKPEVSRLFVNDLDKDGFMSVVHGLDRSKGLDLVLHTPGGDVAATESLVDYLREMFGTDIRAVVPQLALSAGTMIVCAAKSVLMGKHSSLGPIDPQLGDGKAAHAVVEEFQRAHEEIKADLSKAAVWQPIIAQYPPTLVGECENAIKWADEMARKWLASGMFAESEQGADKAAEVAKKLGSHTLTKSHGRHLSAEWCRSIDLKVEMLEDDDALQDAVLSLHHAAMLTLMETDAAKIIENHKGVAVVQKAVRVR